MHKIGIILDSAPNWGGSYQYALNLLDAVSSFSKKNNYDLYAFYCQNEWEEVLTTYDVVRKKLSGNSVNHIIIIDNEKCTFVVGTSQAGWSARLKTPVVEPIHDLMHRLVPEFAEVCIDMELEKRDILYSSIVRNAIGVLVDSSVGANHVKDIYGRCHEDRLYVLPFAAPRYLEEETEKVELPFDKYIFYPAQFWMHKNHKNLILAIDELRQRDELVNCVFVGPPKNSYNDVVSLIEQKELKEQICVLDYVSNNKMKYLYQNARALVMPTFFGPTNIPPLEAIVVGCPVAVSRIYGMPDQLGDAALYFDPSSVDDIAGVLHDLWTDDAVCGKLRENGKKRIKNFTQSAFNANFEKIGEQILLQSIRRNGNNKVIQEFCEKHRRVFVYGAGEYALKVCSLLRKNNIFVEALIVSNLSDNRNAEHIIDKRVITLSEANFKNDDGIICAVSKPLIGEVRAALESRGVSSSNICEIDDETIIALLADRFV